LLYDALFSHKTFSTDDGRNTVAYKLEARPLVRSAKN